MCSFPFFSTQKNTTRMESWMRPLKALWQQLETMAGCLPACRGVSSTLKDLKASAKQGAKHTAGLVWWLNRERFEASSKVSKQHLSLFLQCSSKTCWKTTQMCSRDSQSSRCDTKNTPPKRRPRSWLGEVHINLN